MDKDQIDRLNEKLNELLLRQSEFSNDIALLRSEINDLNTQRYSESSKNDLEEEFDDSLINESDELVDWTEEDSAAAQRERLKSKRNPLFKFPDIQGDFEKFIGENLISKIGILITILGVSIGVKYSIDHDLISPLGRIILGYIAGGVLLLVGLKLRVKYHDYSSVLVSGAMAIMYFITYAAYSFYGLIPQLLCFGLMVLFTLFTVVAALSYNLEIIAVIGLVGAYAVPFLLGGDPDGIALLLAYVAIINIGILILSFLRYWKILYYTAFLLTWLIYASWVLNEYSATKHFALALVYGAVFFVIFYVCFLAYKLLKREKYTTSDTMLLLSNSFIFYCLGYYVISTHAEWRNMLGLFTVANAVVHFIVTAILYKKGIQGNKLFYFVAMLVLLFITLAIPVQLEGNWVTLLWAVQAALLFWVARTKRVFPFERLSYVLMLLAFSSLVMGWLTDYGRYWPSEPSSRISPLVNKYFLSSVICMIAFAFINRINYSNALLPELRAGTKWRFMIPYGIGVLLILTVYFTFYVEIFTYWNQHFVDSKNITSDSMDFIRGNTDLIHYRTIWLVNYSLIFASVLTALKAKYMPGFELKGLNLLMNVLVLFVFLTVGIEALSALRSTYLNETMAEYYPRGQFNLGVRYVSYALVAIVLYVTWRYLKENLAFEKSGQVIDYLFHFVVLCVLSNEFLHWAEIMGASQSSKLGLSILWGLYALTLIVLGIWTGKKYLRIAAMVLFGLTLLKLFLYDISHLSTIAKTVVFVSLGVLLLIISFLYTKYKPNEVDDQ